MPNIRIVYVSKATEVLNERSIRALADRAAQRNAPRGIRGMLCFRDGTITQILEGPEDAVTNLMEAIKADTRHHSVSVIAREEIDTFLFSTWTMGALINERGATEDPHELNAVRSYIDFCKKFDGASLVMSLLLYFTGDTVSPEDFHDAA